MNNKMRQILKAVGFKLTNGEWQLTVNNFTYIAFLSGDEETGIPQIMVMEKEDYKQMSDTETLHLTSFILLYL